MNPADNLRGRARAAELLRQTLDTIEALPFTEPAALDRLEQARNARDAVVLALRALGEDDRQPSRAELDDDRPVLVAAAVWHAALDDTAEITVTPSADGGSGTVTVAGVAGEAGAPPAPAPTGRYVVTPHIATRPSTGLTAIECIGCGHRITAPTVEEMRDLYEAHVPQCTHDRSLYDGWHGDIFGALFGAPGPYTNAARRR
jgi:hypothetical protein